MWSEEQSLVDQRLGNKADPDTVWNRVFERSFMEIKHDRLKFGHKPVQHFKSLAVALSIVEQVMIVKLLLENALSMLLFNQLQGNILPVVLALTTEDLKLVIDAIVEL